ncbi:MAG: hypothetical protein IPK58_13140, partial [Acidobacteria bacterium]|nr:hypothetical protein [Acidobacteriota bacterium]
PISSPRRHKALDEWGYGLSSVRFICGTQSIHRARTKDQRLSRNGGHDSLCVLFRHANGGSSETLLSEEDAIISDGNSTTPASSTASVSAKASAPALSGKRRYWATLKKAQANGGAQKAVLISPPTASFSMDGYIREARSDLRLGGKYDAMVMVDDSHAVRIHRQTRRGTPEYRRHRTIDVITGTLSEALARRIEPLRPQEEIIELFETAFAPVPFSNSSPHSDRRRIDPKAIDLFRPNRTRSTTNSRRTRNFSVKSFRRSGFRFSWRTSDRSGDVLAARCRNR